MQNTRWQHPMLIIEGKWSGRICYTEVTAQQLQEELDLEDLIQVFVPFESRVTNLYNYKLRPLQEIFDKYCESSLEISFNKLPRRYPPGLTLLTRYNYVEREDFRTRRRRAQRFDPIQFNVHVEGVAQAEQPVEQPEPGALDVEGALRGYRVYDEVIPIPEEPPAEQPEERADVPVRRNRDGALRGFQEWYREYDEVMRERPFMPLEREVVEQAEQADAGRIRRIIAADEYVGRLAEDIAAVNQENAPEQPEAASQWFNMQRVWPEAGPEEPDQNNDQGGA